MKIKNNEYIKNFKDNFQITGVKARCNNHVYIHFQGEKSLNCRTRWKHFKQALWNTIRTLGVGILFSNSIQNHWKKALFKKIRVNYWVQADQLSSEQQTDLKAKRNELKKIIESSGFNLVYYDSSDKEVVKPIHTQLCRDEKMILLALNEFPHCGYVAKDLYSNRNIALKMLKWNPELFKKLYEIHKTDSDFIFIALTNNNIRKHFDFKPFINDKTFFLNLLKETKDFTFLNFASDKLLSDPDFIHDLKRFINKCTENIKLFNIDLTKNHDKQEVIPTSISENQEIMWQLIFKNVNHLKFAGEKIKNDKDKLNAYINVSKKTQILRWISEKLKNDMAFMKPFILNDGLLIAHASLTLKENRKLAIKAVIQNPEAYYYIAKSLRNNPEFFFEVYKKAPSDKLIKMIEDKKLLDQFSEKYGKNLGPNSRILIEKQREVIQKKALRG